MVRLPAHCRKVSETVCYHYATGIAATHRMRRLSKQKKHVSLSDVNKISLSDVNKTKAIICYGVHVSLQSYETHLASLHGLLKRKVTTFYFR